MFTPEFKAALALLPSKEKDKLLWRLIKRDELLAHRLEYELLAPYDAVDKRNELADKIRQSATFMLKQEDILSSVLSQFRYMSGDITRHVYITKDKVGEILLNFVLLKEAINLLNNPKYRFPRDLHKYVVYMTNKLFRTCMLVNKLHIDYHIELEDDAHKLGQIIGDNDIMMQYLKHVMFDVKWLLQFDIPEGLDKHYKEVKQDGLLK
ncbi:MAG TPA: hypothetical protein VFC69_09425 [Dysgonamonadaceae bacterium]|nr:hypothetical protein [Dysgonamonadaceae bacterium]